jgi:hypothetical protein
MKDKKGNIKKSPIWLIGDSPPKDCTDVLDYPLDQRYSTVHNIWTPILYRILKKYTKENSIYIDFDKKLYIRNAVTKEYLKPKNIVGWENEEFKLEFKKMKNRIIKKWPSMIITFGSFPFEFIRRCHPKKEEDFEEHSYRYWGVDKLGESFDKAIKDKECIIIPLLHTSNINLNNHKIFTHNKSRNYFDFVAYKLYSRFIEICRK